MPIIIRSVSFAAFGCLVLLLMHQYNLIDFSLIARAFTHHAYFVAFTIIAQTITYFILAYRYALMVRIFGINVQKKDAVSASIVSFSLGQWAPGAMAVMEMIRIGLMFGSKVDKNNMENIRSRIVVSSIYDRLLGFFVLLSTGFIATLCIIFFRYLQHGSTGHLLSISILLLILLTGSVTIIALPFVSNLKFMQNFLNFLQKNCKINFLNKAIKTLQNTLQLLSTGAHHLPKLFMPALLGVGAALFTSLSLYTAALSIDYPIPFLVALAALPLMSLSSLLPIGIGGIGGYQLVTILIFSIFSLDSKLISSANLLQNAISLLTATLLSMFFIRTSFAQIKVLFSNAKFSGKS